MTMNRIRAFLMVALCGGTLLQAATATSCEETLGPALANLAVSVALEVLLGGLGT